MFGYIIFMTWIIPLVKADPYELYKTSVMFREQCEALCEYISPCESFSYSPTTNLCSVWNSMGNGRKARGDTGRDPGHTCSTRPCDDTNVCVPVMTGTQFICLPYGSNTITFQISEWSHLSIVCQETTCTAPEWLIPNTTSTAILTSKLGDTVTYSCAEGYRNTGGTDTSYCKKNAEWSKPTIECKVIQCPEDAPIVGNTTINMTSTNYADVLTYSCVDGYKHFGGNGTSVCQESGTWSDVTIVCAEWEEWGYKVLDFSSQYETASWHAARILSKFDVYPKYGDIKGSWAPSSKYCENGIEWIQVEFAETLYIRRIDIYETCSAGLVKTVSVGRNNTWNTIWTAASVTVITRSRIFSPQFTTLTFPSNSVRFTTDCTSVAGKWVEFDAIKIFGLKSPPPSST